LRGFRLQYREIGGQTTPERGEFFLQIMCQCFSWKSNTSSLPYRPEHPAKCVLGPKKVPKRPNQGNTRILVDWRPS
jgi:hypothetical protein